MVGTLEHYVEKARQETTRELNNFDIKVTGLRTSRIEVPTTDRMSLKRLPEVFRDLAGFIEHHANNPNYDDRAVTLAIQDYIAVTVRPRIQAIHGKGNYNRNGSLKATAAPVDKS